MDRFYTLLKDVTAGVVVFLVSLPLCLGIAHASGAPLHSGLVTGVLAGLVVTFISRSQTSVSGPAAFLAAIVLSQIKGLGSFEAFLPVVIVCGLIQVALGFARLGSVALFVPSNIIRGLTAGIGILLILKQIPHVFGHDPDYEGDFSFFQEDGQNTFSELILAFAKIQPGAAVVGVVSILFLFAWERSKFKKWPALAPLIVVGFGVAMKLVFDRVGATWAIGTGHLVQVPVLESFGALKDVLHVPDMRGFLDMRTYVAAITLAIVASLETLLNLSATEKLDPARRISPRNRELKAQGVGNLLAGMLGGLPMTSTLVRTSVNIQSQSSGRVSVFVNGLLLLLAALLTPQIINLIPLSSLAAILVVTGLKLAPLSLFRQMWREGSQQFIPFATTVAAIILIDGLVGLLIGLGVSIFFILRSNLKRPFSSEDGQYVAGRVVRFRLANQVTFLNKAALVEALQRLPEGARVVIDAKATDYIDPDVLDILREFRDETAPARGISLTFEGFHDEYSLESQTPFLEVSNREVQKALTPAAVLALLREGNERFVRDKRLHRSHLRQISGTAEGQFPIAVVLSCIDSRTSTELIFDLGLGDAFSIRIAGNVASAKVFASMEYSCVVAGAKLILILGHTRCGAVSTACKAAAQPDLDFSQSCPHIGALTGRLNLAIAAETEKVGKLDAANQDYVDNVARRNVELTMDYVRQECPTLRDRLDAGEIAIVGGMYDVSTGRVEFFGDESIVSPPEADGQAAGANIPVVVG